jgi:CHAT domain-containing protein
MVREVYQLMTAQILRENEAAAAWDRRVTQADQQYWSRAAALSALLLGPVAETLSQQRLLIVGEGALQMLPFAALPKPVVGSQRPVVGKKTNLPPATDHEPLIVRHEITYLPSASSLKLLRENRVQPPAPRGWFARWRHSLRSWLGRGTEAASLRSVAVLADPVFEKDDKRVEGQTPSAAQINESQRREVDLSNEHIFLPRLFATLAEAAEIQKAAGPNPVLLKHGFAVNRALLASEELHPYGIVHFATHGFWDSNHPELSGLFLSRFDRQGNKLDGTLRLSDIYNLILPKELVVLSACETAVGKDIRGEGLIALTRGFMYAGAARVMASLWKVDDAATAEMMKLFYQHLLQDQMTPAAALRQAQIAMWQKDAAAVPYHWAAFVLQGEYR